MKNGSEKSQAKNRAWDFFASVKLTVALLLSLAFTSIIGTLIPQNKDFSFYHMEYGEAAHLLSAAGIFDMYHSWWFQLLILLMAVNIIVCSADRLSGTWKIVFHKKGQFSKERFRRRPSRVEFQKARSPETLKDDFQPLVSKGFDFFKTETVENGFTLLAERRRWGRLGVYVVHLSVLVILTGALTGSFFGFDGYANIPEGGETDIIRMRDSEKTLKLDFKIRCDDFDVRFYKTGAPKEYRSRLSIVENGAVALTKDIIVNDPLNYKGIRMFQSSYGRIPSRHVTLSFAMADSGMVYTQKMRMGETIQVPEDMGTFTAKSFENAFNFKGHNIGASYTGIFTPKNGAPAPVTLPVNFPSFDKMRRDKVVISVAGEDKRYYTGLQVTNDPGALIVYVGFIMMIIGFYISFFISHEQIFVEIKEIEKDDQKSAVTVAGISSKNTLGIRRKVETLSEKLMNL